MPSQVPCFLEGMLLLLLLALGWLFSMFEFSVGTSSPSWLRAGR